MEERLSSKYRDDVSPERAKVWTEKSHRYHYNHRCNSSHSSNNCSNGSNNLHRKQQISDNNKVSVVYYLCSKNREFEHPHFMEVTLSSPHGLYLKDVIQRLNALRGTGMASMYSWSCKRFYKNGFVWHDLCADDLIFPARANEYILKGSELLDGSSSAIGYSGPIETKILQNQKSLQEPSSSKSYKGSSPSSRFSTRKANGSEEFQHPCSSSISPESRNGENSKPLGLTEVKVCKSEDLANASTQTEEGEKEKSNITTRSCTKGFSVEEGSYKHERSQTCPNQISRQDETRPEICNVKSVSPPTSTSSDSSSCDKTGTLESLIKADMKKLKNLRLHEAEKYNLAANVKSKASDMILQLISCGSISVKAHNLGLIYKPRFLKIPTSLLSGEINYLTENDTRVMGCKKSKDKECFSGNLVETSMLKEGGVPSLTRSSSLDAERKTRQFDPNEAKVEEECSKNSKCIPISLKATMNKQLKCESTRPSISSDRSQSLRITILQPRLLSEMK